MLKLSYLKPLIGVPLWVSKTVLEFLLVLLSRLLANRIGRRGETRVSLPEDSNPFDRLPRN